MTVIKIAVFSALVAGCIVSPATSADHSLPGGELMLFAGNGMAANFIVKQSIERDGDVVQLATYRVYKDEIPSPNGPIAQDVTAMVIDCSARTFQSLSVDGFQASGRYVASFPGAPALPIEAGQTWDFVARVVCDDVTFGPEATFSSHETARAAALALLKP